MRRASHKTQTIWIRSHKRRRRRLRDYWSNIRNKKLVKVKQVPYLFFTGYRKCLLGNCLTSVYQNATCSLPVNLFCLPERGLEFAYCKFKTKEAGDFFSKERKWKRGALKQYKTKQKYTHKIKEGALKQYKTKQKYARSLNLLVQNGPNKHFFRQAVSS